MLCGVMRLLATAVLACTCLSPFVAAHGGQYGNTPSTGVRDMPATPASWLVWWDTNKDPYLRQKAEVPGPVTGSDDFYLGSRRAVVPLDALAPNEADRRDRIVPALIALLNAERNRDIQSAGLIALAKIGLDARGIDLHAELLARVPRDDQEVRETAVLALGIAGRTAAMPLLIALARDEAEGRKAIADSSVGPRVRTFAVYSMALLARRSGDDALRREVWQVLRELIHDPGIDSRDLRVAAILGSGILGASANRSSGKLLAWQVTEELLAWFGKDLGAGEEFLQAHAPISIARLLGRGDSELHRRCKQVFVDTLEANSRRGNPLLRSAAIALGVMALPEEQHAADAAVSAALRGAYEAGREEHVRMFSVMAIARIGGAANRAWLVKSYGTGNKTMEKQWLAVALGVLAGGAAARGEPDEEVGRMLLDELRKASFEDMKIPLVIGVGLSRYRFAAAFLIKMLEEHQENERITGYLCTALGLLGDPAAKDLLVTVLENARRKPFVLQPAAIALTQLGDRDVTRRLIDMLKDNESVATLSSIAVAIGRIGDRRAIDALITLTTDAEMPKLGKAFVAAALGGLGDRYAEPWNQPLRVDANYSSPVDTLTNGSTGILDIL